MLQKERNADHAVGSDAVSASAAACIRVAGPCPAVRGGVIVRDNTLFVRMTKEDNASAHNAAEYDLEIRKTLPYYDCFHAETISLIKAVHIEPEVWLDTGCGTGSLVEKAIPVFKDTYFILSDPSVEMLSVARGKLSAGSGRVSFLEPCATEDLDAGRIGKCDVVTAIQAHHYLSGYERAKATKTCFDLLNAGGVYVSFENIHPSTGEGVRIGLERWRNYQLSTGREPKEVEKHMERFGTGYFPITVEEHLALLGKAGFSVAGVLWFSYMQAGFYAIKQGE